MKEILKKELAEAKILAEQAAIELGYVDIEHAVLKHPETPEHQIGWYEALRYIHNSVSGSFYAYIHKPKRQLCRRYSEYGSKMRYVRILPSGETVMRPMSSQNPHEMVPDTFITEDKNIAKVIVSNGGWEYV